jgi:hypothetical protein
LDDEIHTVADGVDEHHVGYPQRSERARVVIADIEEQRGPRVGAELVVDLSGQARYQRGVLPVLRQVLTRWVVVDDVHDPVTPLGVRPKQFPVGQQPAEHVLGQLGPIHAPDDLAIACYLA